MFNFARRSCQGTGDGENICNVTAPLLSLAHWFMFESPHLKKQNTAKDKPGSGFDFGFDQIFGKETCQLLSYAKNLH